MSLGEQADGKYGRAGGYHQYLKKVKHRVERHAAKRALKKEDDPIDGYHRYSGWET